MTLRFIPPKPIGKYAVYVESSDRGYFKTHSELGYAKLSFYHQARRYSAGGYTYRAGKILEMVDGEWYVLYDIPDGTKYADLPWIKKKYYATQYGYSRYYDESPTWVDSVEIYRSEKMPIEEYVQFRIKVHDEQKKDHINLMIGKVVP